MAVFELLLLLVLEGFRANIFKNGTFFAAPATNLLRVAVATWTFSRYGCMVTAATAEF